MASELLPREAVHLGLEAGDRYEAVRQAGEALLAQDAVEPGYVDAMREREEMVSSAVGEGFALPHGTDAARALVRKTALAFLQYPDGIDWDGQEVKACVAIAASGDEHVGVISRLARILLDPERAETLRTTGDPDVVLALLTGDEEEPS
jgi:mannitol/fructose-specific phosphotransferase system IIA component